MEYFLHRHKTLFNFAITTDYSFRWLPQGVGTRRPLGEYTHTEPGLSSVTICDYLCMMFAGRDDPSPVPVTMTAVFTVCHHGWAAPRPVCHRNTGVGCLVPAVAAPWTNFHSGPRAGARAGARARARAGARDQSVVWHIPPGAALVSSSH